MMQAGLIDNNESVEVGTRFVYDSVYIGQFCTIF